MTAQQVLLFPKRHALGQGTWAPHGAARVRTSLCLLWPCPCSRRWRDADGQLRPLQASPAVRVLLLADPLHLLRLPGKPGPEGQGPRLCSLGATSPARQHRPRSRARSTRLCECTCGRAWVRLGRRLRRWHQNSNGTRRGRGGWSSPGPMPRRLPPRRQALPVPRRRSVMPCLGTTTSARTRRHALPARQALPAQQSRAGIPWIRRRRSERAPSRGETRLVCAQI